MIAKLVYQPHGHHVITRCACRPTRGHHLTELRFGAAAGIESGGDGLILHLSSRWRFFKVGNRPFMGHFYGNFPRFMGIFPGLWEFEWFWGFRLKLELPFVPWKIVVCPAMGPSPCAWRYMISNLEVYLTPALCPKNAFENCWDVLEICARQTPRISPFFEMLGCHWQEDFLARSWYPIGTGQIYGFRILSHKNERPW